MKMKSHLAIATTVAGLFTGLALAPALAEELTYDDALAQVGKTFGTVPTFMKALPKAGFAGAWAQLRDLEFSENTALSAKEKSLIGLAVVAQIPCQYCIWADAAGAKAAGATDEEIAEAVSIAATERYWSTVLNGLQVNFETFKAEMGPALGAQTTPATK
jgi:AhpD family alkylhydroperoxidase